MTGRAAAAQDQVFRRLALERGADLRALLRGVPTGPGVAQLLGEGERSLLIARPAGLRRWAAGRLGLGRRGRGRPATDLSGVARALLWSATRSGFEQRLVYERLMARCVSPVTERRDLRRPAWLHLDADERFPRLSPRAAPAAPSALYGPFASRDSAARARDGLHRLFPMRPCEVDFEPDPGLALGLGCLHAQLRTCSAPCLVRVSEVSYRELAREVAGFLSRRAARPGEIDAWLPGWVAASHARAVVVEKEGDRYRAWPVHSWAVLDAGTASAPELEAALAALRWPAPETPLADAPWLLDWLLRKRRGVFQVVEEPGVATALAAGLREALAASSGLRDNVSRDQTE